MYVHIMQKENMYTYIIFVWNISERNDLKVGDQH